MTSKLYYWFVGGVMKTLKMGDTEKHNITLGKIYIKGDLPAIKAE